MTPAPHLSRALPGHIAVISATVLLLTGCSPEPEPTPTATPAFASEEEAFAAAEETYREFTARLNEVDTAVPATFEPLFELSSGEFEAADREAYATMHAERLSIQGETKILSFVGTQSTAPFDTVEAKVCLDVSTVRVTDSDGNSRVEPGRPNVYALDITFVLEAERFTIDSAKRDSDSTC